MKVITELWACPRQRTSRWGCPSILERMIKRFGKPDMCLGKTDGIPEDIVTIDKNPNMEPTIIADWDMLPFKDNSFQFGFWDPPYDNRYSKGWKELFRVCSERVAILHQLVYPNPLKSWGGGAYIGWEHEAVIGITTGPNMRIRSLQLWRKKATLHEYGVQT